MSSYALDDFRASLDRVDLPSKPVRVVAAWGDVPDREGGTLGDWSGGFVLALESKEFAYVTGWCDYSGWGCQDGADVVLSTNEFNLEEIAEAQDQPWLAKIKWDMEPIDLNRWLQAGMPDFNPWTEEYR